MVDNLKKKGGGKKLKGKKKMMTNKLDLRN